MHKARFSHRFFVIASGLSPASASNGTGFCRSHRMVSDFPSVAKATCALQDGSEARVVIVTQTDRSHAGSVLGHGPLTFDTEAGRQAIGIVLGS